jgi:hypothetical protein
MVMPEDVRKEPLAAALCAVVEEKIATLSLAGLATYADRVYDATPNEYELDSELELALVYALREARSHVADDTRTAGRLEEARRRREGESNDEYAAPHENLGARR